MARTSRVTLDRQREVTDRKPNTSATQAGVPQEQFQAAATNDKPTLDEIAEEAYAIYLGNGSQDGFDIDHWLEAERRVHQKKSATARDRRDVAADHPNDRT